MEEAARECAVRQSLMQRCHSRPAGSDVFVCDLPSFERVLKRLHLVKSSLNGITAEMLRQLSESELLKMAAARKCSVPSLLQQAGLSSRPR